MAKDNLLAQNETAKPLVLPQGEKPAVLPKKEPLQLEIAELPKANRERELAQSQLREEWKNQNNRLKNWDFLEMTTRFLRNSFITSGGAIVASIVAPLVFGLTVATIGGFLAAGAALATAALVAGVIGYVSGRSGVFLENSLGGQNKDTHLEAKVIATEAAIEGVGGGVLGIFMKVLNPLAKTIKELGKMKGIEIAFKGGSVSGAARSVVSEFVRANRELEYFENWVIENNIDRFTVDARREKFKKERGISFENLVVTAAAEGMVSGLINIQGVHFHFFRSEAKTTFGKGMLFATEHVFLVAESAISGFLGNSREIATEQEFFARISAFFVNNLTQSVISRRPVKDVKIDITKLSPAVLLLKIKSRLGSLSMRRKLVKNGKTLVPEQTATEGDLKVDSPKTDVGTENGTAAGAGDSNSSLASTGQSTTGKGKKPKGKKSEKRHGVPYRVKDKDSENKKQGNEKDVPKADEKKSNGTGTPLEVVEPTVPRYELIIPRGRHAKTYEKIFDRTNKDLKVTEVETLLFYVGGTKGVRNHQVTWTLHGKTVRYHKPHKHGSTLDPCAVDEVRNMLVELGYKAPD